MKFKSRNTKGILIAFIGALLLTPDTLFMRLSEMDIWTMLFWRGFQMGVILILITVCIDEYRKNFGLILRNLRVYFVDSYISYSERKVFKGGFRLWEMLQFVRYVSQINHMDPVLDLKNIVSVSKIFLHDFFKDKCAQTGKKFGLRFRIFRVYFVNSYLSYSERKVFKD